MRNRDMQKRIWMILGIVFAALLVIVTAVTACKKISESKEFTAKETRYKELKNEAEEVTLDKPVSEYRPPLGGRTYDFETLKEENPDIIAWLYIPDTEIDYPVFWNEDNTYYLEHNMDGTKGRPGCLYMENYNAKDFSDAISIVYGHNMRNKTMFGTLKYFQEVPYFKEHQSIYVYTPEGDIEYQIIAVSLYTNDHLLLDRFSVDEEGRLSFEGMAGNEGIRLMEKLTEYGDEHAIYAGVNERTVTEEDHLIVLSTCDRNRQKRLLVIGKQINE